MDAQRDGDALLLAKVRVGVYVPDAMVVDGAGKELGGPLIDKLILAGNIKTWHGCPKLLLGDVYG